VQRRWHEHRSTGEVGVAKARARHSDDDLARSRMRLGHILEFGLCLRLGKSVRLHHVRDCNTCTKTDLLHDGIGDTLVGGGLMLRRGLEAEARCHGDQIS